MGILSKFVSSKVSGYALIALLIAASGACYWFWTELKEFGSLEAQSESQAQTIEAQNNQLAQISADMEKRQAINTQLTSQIATLKQTFSAVRQRIKNAEAKADKALNECLDMHVADGMQFGPSTKPDANQDKAKPAVDG